MSLAGAGKLRFHWQLALSVALLLVLLLHALGGRFEIPLLTSLEAKLYDMRMALSMAPGQDDRIVIVDIDERSLAELGRWPWSRDKLAQLVDRLFQDYQVAVLGFDIVFAEPDTSSGLPVLQQLAQKELAGDTQLQLVLPGLAERLDFDARFARSLHQRPVVLGYYFSHDNDNRYGMLPRPVLPASALRDAGEALGEETGYGANVALLMQHAASAGHFVPSPDSDGVTRRVQMLLRHQAQLYEPLSLAVVRAFLDFPPIEVVYPSQSRADDAYRSFERLQVGPLSIPVDAGGNALVPYRGRAFSFPYFPAVDVLQGKIAPELLQGRIVLIGTSAPGLKDLRVTPLQSVYPGVEIHANLIAGMLDQTILNRPAYLLALEWLLLLLAGAMLTWVLLNFGPLVSSLTTLMVLLLLVGLNLWMWQRWHYVLPLASTVVLVLGLYILNMTWGYFFESRRKRQMASLFGRYAPPELVAKMSADPEKYTMEGQSRELTILFSDVRGFTALSESMEPKLLTRLMNEFLTALTQVIREQYLGTIDKYMGDCVMAFWGAPFDQPQHARQAVLAALDMQRAIAQLNPRLQQQGFPPLQIGIGINTGRVTVGDMGSTFRKAYTVMGDAVNLASRLEGITKYYGVGIVVGESTRQAVPDVLFRELDRVRVKGKQQAIAIYQPLALAQAVSPAQQAAVAQFDRALQAYRQQSWEQAQLLLDELQAQYPEDQLYQLYRQRVSHYRQHPPPADWDGVHEFDNK